MHILENRTYRGSLLDINDMIKRRNRLAAAITTTLVAMAVAVGADAARGEAAELKGSFLGDAFATFANAKAGPIATELGRSALQPCPCEGTNGQTLSNTVDTIKAGDNGDVLTAAATVSTVMTDKTATTASIQDTATITGLNMLGGLITADTIEAVANVSATETTMTASPTGSTFVNLKIAGNPISANVSPNTVIDLPGLGSVTLKKIAESGNFTHKGQILVEMLTVNVSTANSFKLPVGVNIVVAHALSGFNRTQPAAVVAGQAYATSANDAIGDDLENRIGKAALVTMGCQGTHGKTLRNDINTFSVGTLLSIGSAVSTAFGGPETDGAVAKTTSTIEDLGLLGNIISATTITAVAKETLLDGVVTPSTAGSGFAGLTVLGVTIPITVPPNFEVLLPGLGKVVIDEQIVPTPDGGVAVNGLHIFVTTANLLGLPVGSEIIIAHANASAAPF